MKIKEKLLRLLLILPLAFIVASCSTSEPTDSAEAKIVNPVNLTMEIVTDASGTDEGEAKEDGTKVNGFEGIPVTEFIAEEDSNILEATQLFCMANDISITINAGQSYVTEIGGLAEKTNSDSTGWIFKVNGETPSVPADQVKITENDKIRWEFVDFATYSW